MTKLWARLYLRWNRSNDDGSCFYPTLVTYTAEASRRQRERIQRAVELLKEKQR